MTAYRLATRSVWWMLTLVIGVGMLLAFLMIGGARWAATGLALHILVSPVIMLALALFAVVSGRLSAGRQRAKMPEVEHRQLGKILLFLAGFGILSIAVLLVSGTLIHQTEGWERIAGYAVLFGYAALVTVPGARLALTMLVPALPLRLSARFGRKKDWHRAALCMRANRLQEAWDLAERYRAAHPNDSDSLDLEALIRLRQRRKEDALDIADRALEINRNVQGLVRRGQIWLLLGGGQEALADAEAALALNPKAPLAEVIVGYVLIGLRRLDDAIARLRKPKSPYYKSLLLLALAEAARLRGWPDAAEETYRQVTRMASIERRLGVIDSEAAQAYAWARLGKHAEAEKYVRSALARDDRDSLALNTLALLAVRRGDPDAAFAALELQLPASCNSLVGAFHDTEMIPLLAEVRFRRLLAWAAGMQRQVLERVRRNRPAATVG